MSDNLIGNLQEKDFEDIQKGGEIKKPLKSRVCRECGRTTYEQDGVCLKCKNKN